MLLEVLFEDGVVGHAHRDLEHLAASGMHLENPIGAAFRAANGCLSHRIAPIRSLSPAARR